MPSKKSRIKGYHIKTNDSNQDAIQGAKLFLWNV